MPKTATIPESVQGGAPQRPARPFKKQRFSVFLVTGDDALWPLIGADLSGDLILKQLDSVAELSATVPAGQAGIVLWDARNPGDVSATLSTLALHSNRFALIVLDSPANAGVWTLPLQQRQIVAHVGMPISSVVLGKALESAREEVSARTALLGETSGTPESGAARAGTLPVTAAKKARLLPIAIGVAIVAGAGVVAVLTLSGRGGSSDKLSSGLKVENAAPPAPPPVAAGDEKLDGLIEKAQQAMLERHFIEPAAGSALSFYRDALLVDPNNGEARQGLQRLSEILIARVQSALDERKFDVALQSLETARSIDANDPRLSGLDDRIASLRAELGPAQINAALNAQNFDRALQLIDDAARAKSLPAAKLALLRDDARKRRDEFESTRLLKLVATRLQQDKLVEPHGDSAAFYLEQAKQAGEPPATLQPLYQELQRQLGADVRGAIDGKHFGDAERGLAEMHNVGAPATAIAALQKDLSAARGAPAAAKSDQVQLLELAQTRLLQGKVLDPDNDNALYYLNQVRGADPKNETLVQLSGAVQEQILQRAGSALDAGDMGKVNSLLQQAAALGPSPAVDAMNVRLRQKTASQAVPALTEGSLTRLSKLQIAYPTRALGTGVEGWVEIRFTVNPDGTVSDVTVLNASPARTFEQAAIKAVSKMRYQPVIQDGKAVSVNAQFRVVFRIPK